MNYYPFTFQPILKERIWGGRQLEKLYGKKLPPEMAVGESWEISDRPDDQSQITDGPLRGKSLHWLMEDKPADLLGPSEPIPARFPLLIKIIDARQALSLQVHPPPSVAAALGGEPKTELWYVAQAGPAAELFVGLKKGITRAGFERALARQQVADCFHRVAVKQGDAMFLPSGRVHALGADLVIFEIQQNSDTTYRVFDWNRLDNQGRPRLLHLAQSLASIDFADYEPSLVAAGASSEAPMRLLAANDLFEVTLRRLPALGRLGLQPGRMHIIGVVEGSVRISNGADPVLLAPGQFCLAPACCRTEAMAAGSEAAVFLQVNTGRAEAKPADAP